MSVPSVDGRQDYCACPACYDRQPIRVYPPRCPKCGRFVPWDAIDAEDYFDPGAWYGVSTREWTNCKQCGRIDGARYF